MEQRPNSEQSNPPEAIASHTTTGPRPKLSQPVGSEENLTQADAEKQAGKSVLQGEARSEYLASHFAYIRKRIQRALRYPRKAQQAGKTGQAKVRFLICADGQVKDLEIVESSGHAILDKNALKTIKRAAPFPPPPVPALIVMPVRYRRG
jgi:protein TonB